jgi:hypothetical protein
MEPIRGKRRSGRPTNTWKDRIRDSLQSRNLKDDESLDRELWRKKLCLWVEYKKKSTITLFSKLLRHYRRSTRPVKICNENTASTNETKYLGVTLDSKLTYRNHISCIRRKANYRLRQLFLTLNKSSTIDINLELVICKSLLRSILTYVSPVRGYA